VPVADENTSSDSPEITAEETPENPNLEPKGNEMSSESPLFAILGQLETQLSNQKNKIEDHERNIEDKEARLKAAKNQVNLLTMELANEIGAKENAVSEYEKAVSILNSLNN
jgi:ribosome-binding protein aMBF1 (putative translation factor)